MRQVSLIFLISSHADKVRAMDALEALGDDGFHAEQARAFRRPVAAGAGAVFLPGDDDERCSLRLIGDGRDVDGHLLAVGSDGVAAFFAAEHQVLDAHVGECAADRKSVV